MSTVGALQAITSWFERAVTCSMELPTGWFGRPYDNMHQLTWSAARDDKVFLELDGRLHLILADVEIIEAQDADVLELRCSHGVFDWREYGSSRKRHAEVFREGGPIRFHASGR